LRATKRKVLAFDFSDKCLHFDDEDTLGKSSKFNLQKLKIWHMEDRILGIQGLYG
jgi:hypothetical protein